MSLRPSFLVCKMKMDLLEADASWIGWGREEKLRNSGPIIYKVYFRKRDLLTQAMAELHFSWLLTVTRSSCLCKPLCRLGHFMGHLKGVAINFHITQVRRVKTFQPFPGRGSMVV